jgi:hypothetical protein
MKVRKWVFALGVGSVLAVTALLILPLVFRGRIIALAKSELERRVDARVDWSGTRVSLLRDFPNLTLRLDELTVAGVGRFEGDTLASVQRLGVVLDLGSVVGAVRRGEQIVVRSVELDAPIMRLRVLEDGAANWRITRAAAAPTTRDRDGAFGIALRRLAIRDARVVLDNAPAKLFVSMSGLEHTLSGDFSRERSVLETRTHADSLTVRFTGIPYLDAVRLDARAAVDADLAQRKFVFRDNEIRLNELLVGFSGSIGQADERLALDLELHAPRTEFRHIQTLLPSVYARDFASLETSGGVAVDGQLRGAYGSGAFPSFALNARVDSAMFRYPDLPLPARNIFFDLAIANAGGALDSTVVKLSGLRLQIGDDPVTASMVLRTPVSDPDIDVRINGRVNLADASRTLKLDGIQELRGVVAANVAVRARMSDVEARRYDRVSARGAASVRDLTVRSATLPHALAIAAADLELEPASAKLTAFRGTIGSSDVQLSGVIENLIGFVLRDEDLRGNAALTSRQFVLDEWQSKDRARKIIPVPARLDFTLAATIDQLRHDGLELRNARGTIQLKNQRLTLNDFRFNTLGGAIAMSGFYETVDAARPSFDVRFGITDVDIPGAFAQFVTVQRLAPVAQYTQGRFSADLTLSGELGDDLMPLFDLLTGRGSVLTSRVALRGFPALDRLADGLKLELLRNPELDTINSSIDIRNGRLHVQPFQLKLGDARMNVSGSNGVDQSLQYAIGLDVPRALLGSEANRVVASLMAQTGRAGIELQPADVIQLGVQLTGTVRDPAITTGFSGLATSAQDALGRAVARELQQRAEAGGERVAARKEEARRQAQAEAARIVQEAEQRAAQIREEAAQLAATVRREGQQRADSLVARASNPVARAATRPIADRLRKEADNRATQLVREADERANAIVAEARKKADALTGG